MKIFLIFLLSLSYLGGFAAVVAFVFQTGTVPYKEIIILLCVVMINLVSSMYLFRKALSKKTEWALFGAIGNINALLAFWLYRAISNNWKEGKPFFRSK